MIFGHHNRHILENKGHNAIDKEIKYLSSIFSWQIIVVFF